MSTDYSIYGLPSIATCGARHRRPRRPDPA
jgi:hypothetical protein